MHFAMIHMKLSILSSFQNRKMEKDGYAEFLLVLSIYKNPLLCGMPFLNLVRKTVGLVTSKLFE